MNKQSLLTWLVAVVPLTFTGCGGEQVAGRPELTRVTGQVLLEGTPVSGAVVTFHNQTGGPSAFGLTDAAGYYELKTFAKGDGATRGQHRVTVTKFASAPAETSTVSVEDPNYQPPKPENTPPAPTPNELPEVYAVPQTTLLTAIVPDETTDVVLQLEPQLAPKKGTRPARRT